MKALVSDGAGGLVVPSGRPNALGRNAKYEVRFNEGAAELIERDGVEWFMFKQQAVPKGEVSRSRPRTKGKAVFSYPR